MLPSRMSLLHSSLETEIGTMDDDDSNAELQLQKVEL